MTYRVLIVALFSLLLGPSAPLHIPTTTRRKALALLTPALLVPGVAAAATKTLPEEFRQGTLGAGSREDSEPIPYDKYKKLPSGLTLADQPQTRVIRDATKIVKKGSRVNVQWILRKANGYFVDSSDVQVSRQSLIQKIIIIQFHSNSLSSLCSSSPVGRRAVHFHCWRQHCHRWIRRRRHGHGPGDDEAPGRPSKPRLYRRRQRRQTRPSPKGVWPETAD